MIRFENSPNGLTPPTKNKAKIIGTGLGLAGVSLVGLTLLFGSWYTIGQGERGVVTRFGKVVEVAEPGLGFKWPWVEGVDRVAITQQATIWACKPGDPTCSGLGEMQSYSQDQQPANLRVSILWHVAPGQVGDLYVRYHSLEGVETNLLSRKAPQDVKTVFGHYTAPEVIQSRGKFNSEVADALERDITTSGAPLMIDSVQIENIDFSDAYEQAVEARMTAQVEVQKKEQEKAQQEIDARIAVIQAQGQADSQVAVAKAQAQATVLAATAEAQATRLRGDAEASAIKARGDALKANPGLPGLVAAEKWDGKLPIQMIPGGSVPFLNLGKGDGG